VLFRIVCHFIYLAPFSKFIPYTPARNVMGRNTVPISAKLVYMYSKYETNNIVRSSTSFTRYESAVQRESLQLREGDVMRLLTDTNSARMAVTWLMAGKLTNTVSLLALTDS
jgi:hypothetical protein